MGGKCVPMSLAITVNPFPPIPYSRFRRAARNRRRALYANEMLKRYTTIRPRLRALG